LFRRELAGDRRRVQIARKLKQYRFISMDNLPRTLAPIGVLLISVLLYTGLGGGGLISTLLIGVLLLIAIVSFVNTQQGHNMTDELKKQRDARRQVAKKLQGGKPPQSVAEPSKPQAQQSKPTTTSTSAGNADAGDSR
jgi:predicted lipid-binding transport protein (Tim44 family)